jgi:hypothetical protein
MIKFTDLYVNTVVRGLSNPDERLVAAGAGSHQPFWSFGLPWFRHSYLLIATNERLLVLDHRKGLLFDRLDAVTSHRWSDIASIKLSGVFAKKLVAKDATNRVLFAMKLPPVMSSPIANNTRALETLVQTWEHRRALAAAPAAYGAVSRAALPQTAASAAHS